MIELKYKNWEDISVELFYKLQAKLGNNFNLNEVESLDKNISIIALLSDNDEDTIADMPINDFSKMVKKIDFLKKMPNVEIKDKYIINNKKYYVHTNLKKMTAAQYIDFQTLQKDYYNNLKYLLACFIIPEGKQYAQDYDIDEVANDIFKHLSIVDANSIMFFFAIQYRALTKGILTYLEKKMKKAMRKEKNKAMKIKIGRSIIQMNRVMNLVENGDGFI